MFDDLIGKPFEDFGRGPESYDCYGLAMEVSKRLGYNLPDFGSVCGDHVRTIQHKVDDLKPKFKKLNEPEVGSIVLMRTLPGAGNHLGIVIDRSRFIHTTRESGCHVSRLNDITIKNRIVGIYRYCEQSIQLNYIYNPFEIKPQSTIPVECYRNIGELLRSQGLELSGIVIYINGMPISDLNHQLWPGDLIHIYPTIHGDTFATVGMIALSILAFSVVGPAAGGLFPGIAGSIVGAVAGVATITAGGLLLNGLLSKPAKIDSRADDNQSPTYGFGATTNNRDEGYAIPVIYGYVATAPQIINQYLAVDSDGDQWSYTLLAVHEGPTNNTPTAEDVLANDQLITLLETDSYTVAATDGSASPTTSVLSDFERLHQMRYLDKFIGGTAEDINVSAILNFNGTNGSTTILDESSGGASWTCKNTAALSTTNPWYGTSALDLETSGDYIEASIYSPFDIFGETTFDIEVFFRQDALTDSAICYQYLLDLTIGFDYDMYRWGLFYIAGELVFQAHKQVFSTSAYTVYCNYSQSVTLSINTWHHIRVARSSNSICFWLDGVRQTPGTYALAATSPTSPTTTSTYIGRGSYFKGLLQPVYEKYGECKLDSYRFAKGQLLYDFNTDLTVPTIEPIATATQYYTTLGPVDRISVFLEARNGLYDMADDSSLDSRSVNFLISYRQFGLTWTHNEATVNGSSQYPVRKQFDYAMPSRGIYEVRVSRTTPESQKTTVADRMHWAAIDEVLDEFLHYPYLQCVAIALKAQDSLNTRIPTYKIISNVSQITVPTLTGASTQTIAATNNAYVALDILTNEIYGAGLDTATYIDSSAWQDWIDWCDGSVDGYSRCQFNMTFDASYSLDKSMQHVENCGRARIVTRGTSISAIIEKPGSRGYIYSDGNIIEGSSMLTFMPQSERTDAVEISFKDKDLNWADNKAFAPSSDYESLGYVPRITRITIPGINNYEQALREATLRQQLSENTKRMAQFETGIEGLHSLGGDIIEFQSSGNAMAAGGRIAHDDGYRDEYTGTTVYLDNVITLDETTYSGNCVIVIRNPDDTLSEVNITGPWDIETNKFTIDSSLTVYRFSPYLIRRNTGEVYLYRIAGMRRSSEQNISVTAIQYVSTSYYHANYGSGATPI